MKDMMIGVDLAKNVFQVHGALRTGEVQFRKKLTRKQFPAFMAKQEPCLIIFESPIQNYLSIINPLRDGV